MKDMTDLFVIIITTLMTLLVMGMVLIEFGTIDTTLLAGFIAFFGAIIGGLVTLMGVNKTIEFTKRNEEQNSTKEKLRMLGSLQRDIRKIVTKVWEETDYRTIEVEELVERLGAFYVLNNNIFEKASRVSVDIYFLMLDLEEYAEELIVFINEGEDMYYDEDEVHENIRVMLNKLIDMIIDEISDCHEILGSAIK